MYTPVSASGNEPPTKFSKRKGLTGPQFLEGGCWEKVCVTFFRGLQFLHLDKSESEIFNDKKVQKPKMFFSVITKNLNWEIITKN